MPATQRVLVIAATDSSGGAGLTRDLQTLTAWRMEACCAVTAVTAQTDARVQGLWGVPTECLAEQIRTALSDGRVAAIKIGLLATDASVQRVAAELPERSAIPIVLDPVLVASSGGALLEADGLERLRRELLPRVSLLTPNLPEAAALLGAPLAQSEPQMLDQMRALQGMGVAAVLLKGGHEAPAVDGQVTDRLLAPDGELLRLRTARVPGSRRGTGCSLASAIAAQLAVGTPLSCACAGAQAYVAAALAGDPWSATPLWHAVGLQPSVESR
ncbi:MAG TPA: hydroxymethylpyrimidine/phosphomethylpyrimidine kinase [Steroidobacteraceae bacterium]|nr:hydroxymethylpyrimidine/phosphomethylpyrimidine kinase [Steroidobacteraceae bacterium]